MKVVIDRGIENNPEYLDVVQKANDYLASRLGDWGNTVEADWSLPVDHPETTTLRLRSVNDVPGEATSTIPMELLRSPDRRMLRVGGVLSSLLGQRTKYRLKELRQMVAELKD